MGLFKRKKKEPDPFIGLDKRLEQIESLLVNLLADSARVRLRVLAIQGTGDEILRSVASEAESTREAVRQKRTVVARFRIVAEQPT